MSDLTDGSNSRMDSRVAITESAMERFVETFAKSARRWEMVVYPMLLAFVVLAAYGFFLIYTLSKDIHILAQSVDPQMSNNLTVMSTSITYLSENVRTMTRRIDTMSQSMEEISVKMDSLETLEPMLTSIESMNYSMQGIMATNDQMRQEMTLMSRSVARPMSFMNSFVPW